jgi:hypothetical protein
MKEVSVDIRVRLIDATVLGADEAIDNMLVAGDELPKPGMRSDAEHDDRVSPFAEVGKGCRHIRERLQVAVTVDEVVKGALAQVFDLELLECRDQTPQGELPEGRELTHCGDPKHVLELLGPPQFGDFESAISAVRRKIVFNTRSIRKRSEHVKRKEHQPKTIGFEDDPDEVCSDDRPESHRSELGGRTPGAADSGAADSEPVISVSGDRPEASYLSSHDALATRAEILHSLPHPEERVKKADGDADR